jgi:hypothetical protein
MIESAVSAALSSIAPAGGVWAGVAPDGTLPPYIVFARISSVPCLTLAGDAPGLTQVRVQVTCFARTYEGAKSLADSVVAAMLAAPFRNNPAGDQDLYDSEARLHYVALDFLCWQ